MVVGAVVLILIAVSNRERVSLGLWPLPFLLDMPLYLLFFLGLLVGGLFGLSAAGISGRRRRRELQRQRRRSEALERELAATQAQLESRAEAPRARLPASRQFN